MSLDGWSLQSPANGSPSASFVAGDPGAGRGLRFMNARNSRANASVLLASSANGSDDISGTLDEANV